jgi:hypothetical protein
LRAKYVVLAPGVTVIEFPVPTKVEPQPPVYQYTVPTAPWAVKVAEEPTLQIAATEEVIEVGAAGFMEGQDATPTFPPDVVVPVTGCTVLMIILPEALITWIRISDGYDPEVVR